MGNPSDYSMPESTFHQLVNLANHAVITYAASEDYASIRTLISIAERVHHDATDESEKVYKDSMIEKSLMITMISKHDCWHDSDLWCGMFYHGFSEAMERLAMDNPGDKEDEVRQVACSELTALTNSMFLIGLSAKEVIAFLNAIDSSDIISRDQYKMLKNFAEEHAVADEGTIARANSSPRGGRDNVRIMPWRVCRLDGWDQPSIYNKCNKDSMKTMVRTLTEQSLPDTQEDLRKWLKLCENGNAVKDLLKELYRFIQGRVRHELRPGSYYTISSMLTRCLSTCEGNLHQNFGCIYIIMQISLVMHGPIMDAQSPAMQWMKNGPDHAKRAAAFEDEDFSSFKSPGRVWGQSNLDSLTCMSRATSRHAIWEDLNYWIGVLRKDCDDATLTLHLNAEDPSERHFALLNKTVQLMLTFQVPQRLIAQFIAQVLDQYHWSSEYEPMCEHLWESIKSGISGYDK